MLSDILMGVPSSLHLSRPGGHDTIFLKMHVPSHFPMYTSLHLQGILYATPSCQSFVTTLYRCKRNINNFRPDLSSLVIFSDFLLNPGISYDNFEASM